MGRHRSGVAWSASGLTQVPDRRLRSVALPGERVTVSEVLIGHKPDL
jgi:hypothetical protein